MKRILISILLIASITVSRAQVGFNNPNPDGSSLLDMNANDKGLLIPRMTAAQRDAISSPAESLLIYVTDENNFNFYHSGVWYSLNEWVKTAGSTDVSLTGNATLTGSLSTGSISNAGGLTTSTVSSNFISSNSISSSSISNTGMISTGSLSSSGTVSGGSLSITGFANNALVPTGAILMWYGSITTIPSGWALCDGSNGTPNLRDRFIVGAGTSYVVGNTGGAKSVTLTINEMPSHTHTFNGSGDNQVDDINSGVGQFRNNNDRPGTYTGQMNATGGGAAHENRPPYYALAYIMKL